MSKKKALLEKALEHLSDLYRQWGLSLDDWCLVGEWALILQGYNIEGRKGIIDVYIDRKSLPWKVKRERQAIPPRDSRYFNDWIKFTEKTKFGLDMIPIPESSTDPRSRASIRKDSVVYQLPNGNRLRVNTPLAEVEIHQWLFQQYAAEDVGKENIRRWWDYILGIQKEAERKNDLEVVDACKELRRKFESD